MSISFDRWRAAQRRRFEADFGRLRRARAARRPRPRVTKDVYGRTVAVCRVNGKDIGEAMVRSGMAYAAYSERYLSQERQARIDRLGIHARRCASPAHWRASHPT